jgi:hypothetical protein
MSNSVLEQPLLLSLISQTLNPKDIVHLKLAGYRDESRFQDTLDAILKDHCVQAIEDKKKVFIKTVTSFVNKQDSLERIHEQVRNLNQIYDYIVEHIWFRDEFPKLDRVVELKLLELVYHDYYHHNALYYLAEIYAIYVHAEYQEESNDFVEYILDTQGVKYYL